MWLWLPVVAAALAAAAWFLVALRRREPAPAGAGLQLAAGGVTALPWRQRIRAAMAPGTHKVRGPNLWQRIRLSGFGRALFSRSSKVDRVPLSYRIRNSRAAARLKRTETADSWRARRDAKEVQQRIRERHSDS